MKIMHIVGARPNFMKISPIMREMARHREITQTLVHTGQHYDEKMSKIFFEELGLAKPDIDLEVGSGSHAQQTARIMSVFESVLLDFNPDLLLVVGDVNSTLACSLVASKLGIPIAHVEAGLRSFDRSMPEETNRLLTDVLSDLLFTTSPEAEENLCREGIAADKIFFVGNTMIDSLLRLKEAAAKIDILTRLNLRPQAYALVTLHRPSNVDNASVFRGIVSALKEIASHVPVVFPVHPRTRQHIAALALEAGGSSLGNEIRLIEPQGYIGFMKLTMEAAMVLTDSGGIQEETSVLNVPCITIRENTERPITVRQGTNVLAGTLSARIVAAAKAALQANRAEVPRIPLWDGKAAERIVPILLNWHRSRQADARP